MLQYIRRHLNTLIHILRGKYHPCHGRTALLHQAIDINLLHRLDSRHLLTHTPQCECLVHTHRLVAVHLTCDDGGATNLSSAQHPAPAARRVQAIHILRLHELHLLMVKVGADAHEKPEHVQDIKADHSAAEHDVHPAGASAGVRGPGVAEGAHLDVHGRGGVPRHVIATASIAQEPPPGVTATATTTASGGGLLLFL